MKFLKTFLFTISLTFISFGVVTLSGFCEAAPVLTPNSSSFQVIQGGGMPYYYGMQGYGEMYFMSPEFNTTFMNDLADVMNEGYDYSVSQGYALPTNGWSSAELALANKLSGLFTKGLMNYAEMSAAGYVLISHNAKQWGQNAKEYFVGKVNETTGQITDAVGNIVTKVTQQGIDNYLSANTDLIQSGSVDKVDSLTYKYGKVVEFPLYYQRQLISPVCHLEFNDNVLIFSNGYKLRIACKYNSNLILPCSGFYISNNNSVRINAIGLSNYTHYNEFTFNGETWCIYDFTAGGYIAESLQNYFAYPSSFTNEYSFVTTFFGGSPSAPNGYLYDFSSTTGTSFSALLERLVGKYVDSNILDQINDKIAQAPIIIQYDQNNNPVPVAEPSPDLLDEIEDLIDTAIANSSDYEQLLEPLEEPEPEPEPDPDPVNQGTSVPDDFPIAIFNPINDSVGSIFDFVSIFEPLFYIFSFSAGLLGLWLVVPFVILFLILFRLLK